MRLFSQHTAEIELLRNAIVELKHVSGIYHGHYRVFCPHILGLKEEKWHVLGWQFDGSSESGRLPNWRCMALEELSNASSRSGVWHRGLAKGVGKQHCIDWVDTIVDPAYAALKAA